MQSVGYVSLTHTINHPRLVVNHLNWQNWNLNKS